MAKRRFTATILNELGKPFQGRKVRLVRHLTGTRVTVLGKDTVVPANGYVRFDVEIPALTNDRVSLQMLINNRWQNIQTPVNTGTRNSVSMGRIIVMDEMLKVGDRQVRGLNLSEPVELTEIVKDSRLKIGELESKATEIESEVKKSRLRISELESKATELESERKSFETQLEDKTQELSAVHKEKIELEEKAQIEIADLKTQLSILEEFKQNYDAKKAISLKTLCTNTGVQLQEAQLSSAVENPGFAISNITMELKGVPVKGMEEFEFLDTSELSTVDAAGLSSIIVSFSPTPGNVQVESLKVKVPDIIDQGERMAVRKLEEKGLFADIHYQTTDKENKEGRVLMSKTPAGQEVEAGSVIEIYIGKLLKKDSD